MKHHAVDRYAEVFTLDRVLDEGLCSGPSGERVGAFSIILFEQHCEHPDQEAFSYPTGHPIDQPFLCPLD